MAGLPLPCVAVNEKLVGLAPIAGLTEGIEVGGGEINCAKPGISAPNRPIVLPAASLLLNAGVLPAATALSGVAVDAVLAMLDCVAVAGEFVMLIVARGAGDWTYLVGKDGSLDGVMFSA